MRADRPSVTALGVAMSRSRLDRPSAPTGDPGAEARLDASIVAELAEVVERTGGRRRDGFLSWVSVRTRFFDDAVLHAIGNDVHQIVILGAGYDGRALRFRTPGVRFFEVDHPATQLDKRERLASVDARTDDITFVAADFTEPGLGDALAAAGHRDDVRSLFMCEGVLRYLPEASFRELLRVAAERAETGSVLAVSISTREPDRDDGPSDRDERERLLAEVGEPVLTVPPRAVALQWLAEAGWSPRLDDVADATPATRNGRLLVTADR